MSELERTYGSTMALEAKSPDAHNRMAGRRIPHPASTNYEDFACPVAKRLKSSECSDSSMSRQEYGGNATRAAGEIPDSEDDGPEEAPRSSQTDLEISLPPVRTDKEAIADYEATRAGDSENAEFLRSRLGERKWVKGKSSIYVDAFNLALETVLDEESHLFDEPETALFEYWKNLSYEAQYL